MQYSIFALLLAIITSSTACVAPSKDAGRTPAVKLPKAVTPSEAMKLIRDEFRALPRPIIAGYDKNAHPFRPQIVRLFGPAGDFMKRHGRLAVVVSLYPMMTDKRLSGDVWAMISVATDDFRDIDELLFITGYFSPDKSGKWKIPKIGLEFHSDSHYLQRYSNCFYPDDPPEG